MISELYNRDMYLNKNIDILSNKTIIEYDLKSANTSLCREYELLPEKQIEAIEDMPKNERVKKIGKLMRKDKKFNEGLKKAFKDIRKRFFIANNIEEGDILSIKKDAIFCLDYQEHTKFGACVFSEKNIYSSYMYLNGCEFYYKRNLDNSFKLDVKGIDNTIVEKHNGFMNNILAYIFQLVETSDKQEQLTFMKNFIDKYKHLKLEVGYYREYNQESIIRLNDSDETYDDEIFIPYTHKHEHLDIDYNFFYILLPITKLLI